MEGTLKELGLFSLLAMNMLTIQRVVYSNLA